MQFYRFFWLLAALCTAPALALATTRDARSEFSYRMSQELYCQVATTMSGNIGILIGLAIAAMGLVFLIFHGPSLSNLFLIFAGVLITAVPAWFQAAYESLEELTSTLGSEGNTLDSSMKLGSMNANCDYNSEAVRPALEQSTGTATDPQFATAGTDSGTSGPRCGTATGTSVVSGSSYCSSGYGQRDGRLHGGIDFAAAAGTPVTAALSGTVARTGYDDGGYGNFVVIDYGNGIYGRYSHLQSATTLKVGESVSQSQVIGAVGNTGSSYGKNGGYHLDYSETTNGYRGYVNPCSDSGTRAVCG